MKYAIEFIKNERHDGSVIIFSHDLPMFCVVGENENHAMQLVEKLLPEYLTANVPDYVELKEIK